MSLIPMIADLPVVSRPRERMLAHGPTKLSDMELLAVLLGSGAPGKNALYLAQELLVGGLTALRGQEVAQLTRRRGIGQVKALRIAAAFELGRRLADAEEPELDEFKPDDVARTLMRRYAYSPQESVGAYFLNSRLQVLRESSNIYIGTVQKACDSTRDIVREALRENAAKVVVYHNHPSGDPEPSMQDRAYTKKLQESLQLVDITLLEHMIIGRDRYYNVLASGL
jgi:DNA repair protein RadC